MIEFEGKISNKNRLFLMKQYKTKIFWLSLWITFGILMVAVVPFYLIYSTIGLLMLILIPVFLFIVFYVFAVVIVPIKIVVNDESIFLHMKKQGNNQYPEEILIEDIMSIENYKDFYLCITKKNNKFLCQKNLLKNGTLEEFESLFADKIEQNAE